MKIREHSEFDRTMRMELHRAILSPRFVVGVCLMLAWLCFNAMEAAGNYQSAVFAGVPVLIRLATTNHFSTGPVLLSIATIPYALSFLAEQECGFQKQAFIRVGPQNYGVCKAIATFFSGFLMGAAALAGFIAFASVLGIPHTVRYEEVKNTYAVLVVTAGPMWYYAARLLHIGLVCGQAAVFAILAMVWIPNSYVGALAPLFGYYLYECILSVLSRKIYDPFLWRLISADALLSGETADDPLFSFWWTACLLSFAALCFGMFFVSHVEKEATK